MKLLNKKYIKTLAVIIVTVVLVKIIMGNPPHSNRGKPAKAAVMSVQVQTLAAQDFQVKLDSFGIVKPRTQSVLVAQVSGQITAISDNFRDGEFFQKGDVLVTLDDRDYQAELKIAKAGVLNAEQALLEEQAKAAQANEDWQRLGNGEQANDLVLRKPQLAAAQAQLWSAQAKYEKADLAFERTKIIAPYSGRILKKHVDVGQVVSTNSKLADIFATDKVEIRLPIHNSDLAFIDLPEQYSDQSERTNNLNEVSFTSDLIRGQKWQGQLIRTEGSIDDNAQQLYVVAQIDNPFKRSVAGSKQKSQQQSAQQPLQQKMTIKIGQYLKAKISGKLLSQAMIIPNTSIYQGSYVYIVVDGLLQRRAVTIAWQNDITALISSGLDFGQQLVLTSLGQVSSGTAVSIVGKLSNQNSSQSNPQRKQKKSTTSNKNLNEKKAKQGEH